MVATKETVLERFLKLSGYRESDLTGYDAKARRFVTSNGGKYALSPSGKNIRTLSGPDYPKQAGTESEEE